MLYEVTIKYEIKSSHEVYEYHLTACTRNAVKFEACKYLFADSVKVISITFNEHE